MRQVSTDFRRIADGEISRLEIRPWDGMEPWDGDHAFPPDHIFLSGGSESLCSQYFTGKTHVRPSIVPALTKLILHEYPMTIKEASSFSEKLRDIKVGVVQINHAVLLFCEYLKMGPEGAKGLNFKSTNVESLDLSNNAIGDEGVEALDFKGTKMRSVFLRENNIGDKGAVAFVRKLLGTPINTVDFSQNNISDVGLAELNFEGTNVANFYMSRNPIANLGAIAFVRKLTKDTPLRVIDLSKSQIDKEGVLAIAKHLKDKNVTEVSLPGEPIDESCREQLVEECPHIDWRFD